MLSASYPLIKVDCEPKENGAQRVATDLQHLHHMISQYIPLGMHITDHVMNLLQMRSQRG